MISASSAFLFFVRSVLAFVPPEVREVASMIRGVGLEVLDVGSMVSLPWVDDPACSAGARSRFAGGNASAGAAATTFDSWSRDHRSMVPPARSFLRQPRSRQAKPPSRQAKPRSRQKSARTLHRAARALLARSPTLLPAARPGINLPWRLQILARQHSHLGGPVKSGAAGFSPPKRADQRTSPRIGRQPRVSRRASWYFATAASGASRGSSGHEGCADAGGEVRDVGGVR